MKSTPLLSLLLAPVGSVLAIPEPRPARTRCTATVTVTSLQIPSPWTPAPSIPPEPAHCPSNKVYWTDCAYYGAYATQHCPCYSLTSVCSTFSREGYAVFGLPACITNIMLTPMVFLPSPPWGLTVRRTRPTMGLATCTGFTIVTRVTVRRDLEVLIPREEFGCRFGIRWLYSMLSRTIKLDPGWPFDLYREISLKLNVVMPSLHLRIR